MLITTKQQIRIFWGSYAKAARCIGVTRQYITRWSDPLTQRQADWATGAALRTTEATTKSINELSITHDE